MLSLGALNALDGVRHGFFTRAGGVSGGLYASMNCGYGSSDDPEAVRENRARAAARLDVAPEGLVTVHQVHGTDVAVAERPWAPTDAPRADALVTDRPGVALGVLSADCVPILLADAQARVIGAAHAGWKGAKAGVAEATVRAMTRLGADPGRIAAAIGPHIAQRSYEVGDDYRAAFVADEPGTADLFAPGRREGKWLFDLGTLVERRLAAAGVRTVHRGPWDTVAEEERFFSYRRATLRGEPDYGRGLSAIALEG
jgi:YfiH family protein